jgi:hypothetical protein
MLPVAAPLFAERPAVILNNTVPLHDEKSIVTLVVAVPPGAMSPAIAGTPAMTGVHAAPDVCCSVKLAMRALNATPGPLLPMVKGQTRAFVGPDLMPTEPPREVGPGAKFAVTVAAAFMVMFCGLVVPLKPPLKPVNA